MLQDNVLYCVDLFVNVDDVFDVGVDVEVDDVVSYRFEDFETHKRIFFSYVKESHVFYSTPSTEGIESTGGNSVCLSVCLFVCLSVITFSFVEYSII